MALAEKNGTLEHITQLTEQALTGTPIEVVEVQLRGAGKARLLRVYIDKPGGVTHEDCALLSEKLGKLLDEEDSIPDSYTLEVSSPGVDRKLSKPRDFERVVGQKIKVTVRQPIDGRTHFEGQLKELARGVLEIQTASGEVREIPLEQVQKANLKFEW